MLKKKLQFILDDNTVVNPHRKSFQRLAKATLDFSHQNISYLTIIETKKSLDALYSGMKQLESFIKELDQTQQILNGGDHSIDGDFINSASEIHQLKSILSEASPTADMSIGELNDALEATAEDAISDFNQAKKKSRQIEQRLVEMTSRALAKGLDVDAVTLQDLRKTKWADIDLFDFDSSKSAPRSGDAYRFYDSHTAGHCVAQFHAAKRCEQAQKENEQLRRKEAQKLDAKVVAEMKDLVSQIKGA